MLMNTALFIGVDTGTKTGFLQETRFLEMGLVSIVLNNAVML